MNREVSEQNFHVRSNDWTELSICYAKLSFKKPLFIHFSNNYTLKQMWKIVYICVILVKLF